MRILKGSLLAYMRGRWRSDKRLRAQAVLQKPQKLRGILFARPVTAATLPYLNTADIMLRAHLRAVAGQPPPFMYEELKKTHSNTAREARKVT